MLAFTRPEDAAQLLEQAQQDAVQRWNLYKDMAERWPSTSPGRHGMVVNHETLVTESV